MKITFTNHFTRTTRLVTLFAFLYMAFSFNALKAQCKPLVMAGIEKLEPYSFTGQVNSAMVKSDGKPTEFHLTFYKGRVYNVLVNFESKNTEKIWFRVLDENRKEVYNSKDDSYSDMWIFFSNSTQNLIVQINSTKKSEECVVVLVGIEVPKRNNSIRDL